MEPARLVRFDDPAAFLARVAPALDEVRCGLLLGIAGYLAQGGSYGDAPPWLASVEAGGRVVGAALRTPPNALLLSPLPREAVALLVEDWVDRGEEPGAVRAEARTAEAFAEAWCARTGACAELSMHQRLHRLDAVVPPRPVPGRMRPAAAGDRDLVLGWGLCFAVEARLPGANAERPPESYRPYDDGRLFLWEDGEPVSMASWTRPTEHGISIASVYTPPELRGRGYASALVAALTQRLLDEGRRFCTLHTDLANPTSNKIYAAIGYRPVQEGKHFELRR